MKHVFCTTNRKGWQGSLCCGIDKDKRRVSYSRRGAVVNWWEPLSLPLNSWQRRMSSIHPLSVEEWKRCFAFFPVPWKDSLLYSLCAAVGHRAAHVFNQSQLWPRVPRLPARSAPLFHKNQEDSHPTRNGVKSTFVGQVGFPLRAQPDA